jgi:myo-inositol-1(or 4)-monophosphatase
MRYNRESPVHGMLMASGHALAEPLAQALRRLRENLPQRS